MLAHLRMQNIALIDDLSLELTPGLNILTGETGAGKSILLDGINLALGGRLQRELLQNKEAPSRVDLLFLEEDPAIMEHLRSLGLSIRDDEILMTRTISPNGRSTCRINGQIVTTQQMKEAARSLIDIHGQHEHQSILDVAKHREILDQFDDRIVKKLETYQKQYHAFKALDEELQGFLKDEQDKERLLSLLEYERDEIEQSGLREGEEEELRERRRRLYHTERLQSCASAAYEALRGSESAACDQLDRAISQLSGIEDMDPNLITPLLISLRETGSVLEDIGYQLRDYVDTLEMDPKALTQIEDRIAQINRLKTKYGNTVSQIMEYLDGLNEKIDRLLNVQQTKEQLASKRNAAEQELKKTAEELHSLREKVASEVSAEITRILSTLQFQDPFFTIALTPTGDFGPYGTDAIEFRIRTNVGDEVKPLQKIASGGEMSRVMLAIKTVLARRDEIPTLIFDEIDTGISGRTAQSVAEKMCQIAFFHQVLCVTHLPQIAAMADTHFEIRKLVEDGHTRTTCHLLDREEQIDELARLTGGVTITESVRKNATEIKEQADNRKQELCAEVSL